MTLQFLLSLLLTVVAAASFTKMLDYTPWLVYPNTNSKEPPAYYGSDLKVAKNKIWHS